MVRTPSDVELPLRGRVLMAHAVGLLLVTAIGLTGIATLGLSLVYVQKAVAVYAIIAVVTLVNVDQFHPFPQFGAANLVTTIRAVIVALVAALIGEHASGPVGSAAAVAAVLATCLDGWLARRSGLASAFGARFDMETDALLILALSVLAWRFGQAGSWIVLAGLLRYLFIAAGWLAPRMRAALVPSWRRQAICVAQIVGLSLVVSPFVRPPASTAVAAFLLALLLYSFAVDTIGLWRRA
jgi:phosphatidylglycerophosphate synthase